VETLGIDAFRVGIGGRILITLHEINDGTRWGPVGAWIVGFFVFEKLKEQWHSGERKQGARSFRALIPGASWKGRQKPRFRDVTGTANDLTFIHAVFSNSVRRLWRWFGHFNVGHLQQGR